MNYEKIGKVLIFIGLTCFVILTSIFLLNTTKLNIGKIDSNIWSHYAGVIGGIVGTILSFTGVLFLFVNLREQRRNFSKQQVETRFFQLIQLHRDNVKEIESKGNIGRSVFIDIKDEFHDMYDSITQWYTLVHANNNKYLWNYRCIQIAYLIVFFGINNSSTDYLKQCIERIMDNDQAFRYFDTACLNNLIKTHERIKEENKNTTTSKKYLPTDGHQSMLGHYFRHLFQTVNYINSQPTELLNYKQKYDYVKTLRAQLSTHEQAVFLYNSISPLGHSWEIEQKDINEKVITKYNLVKNLPLGFSHSIEPKDFFPDIYFEFDIKPTTNRLELEKLYS